MDYVNLIFTHPFLLLWLGQFIHTLKEVKEIETRQPGVTVTKYVKRHRYGVAFSVAAGLAAYAMLHEMGELSAVSAFMAGYMSDSIINAAASRVTRRVSGDDYGMYSNDFSNSGFEEDYTQSEEYLKYYADNTSPESTRKTRDQQDGS